MNEKIIEKILLKYLNLEDKDQNTENTNSIGKYVIVRSYYSGVLFGKLISKKEGSIILHEARRLYYWKGVKGLSLSEVSIHGIKKDSKVTEPINIEITDPTVCEIIECSQTCIDSINACPNYQP